MDLKKEKCFGPKEKKSAHTPMMIVNVSPLMLSTAGVVFLLTISYVRNTQRCFDQNCLVVMGLFEVKFLVFKKKKTYEHTILNKH